MIFYKLIETLIEITFIMFIGYCSVYFGIVKKENFRMITDFIVLITTPNLIFYSICINFAHITIKNLYIIPIASILVVVVTLLSSVVFLNLFRVINNYKNIYYIASTFSATLFFGLPINIAIFGDKSVPYVILYDLGHTTLFWTIGMWILSKKENFSINQLKKIINPPFISLVFSIFIMILGIKPPDFILKSSQMVGNMTIPLAIMYIGMNMKVLKKGNLDFSVLLVAVIKLFVSPLIAYIIVYFLRIPEYVKIIIILEAAMPTILTLPPLVNQIEGNGEYASKITFIVNILSFLAIPIVFSIINIK
ncbi:MAG: AEC family transporter [Thermoanaerobacteraceae bacterium]